MIAYKEILPITALIVHLMVTVDKVDRCSLGREGSTPFLTIVNLLHISIFTVECVYVC